MLYGPYSMVILYDPYIIDHMVTRDYRPCQLGGQLMIVLSTGESETQLGNVF